MRCGLRRRPCVIAGAPVIGTTVPDRVRVGGAADRLVGVPMAVKCEQRPAQCQYKEDKSDYYATSVAVRRARGGSLGSQSHLRRDSGIRDVHCAFVHATITHSRNHQNPHSQLTARRSRNHFRAHPPRSVPISDARATADHPSRNSPKIRLVGSISGRPLQPAVGAELVSARRCQPASAGAGL